MSDIDEAVAYKQIPVDKLETRGHTIETRGGTAIRSRKIHRG